MALIWVPWAIKLLYGITADSIPIFSSRKRNWLILMGLIEVLGLIMSATIHFSDVTYFVVIQMIIATSGAFMDVIADALMVMQAKRDPDQGSQEL